MASQIRTCFVTAPAGSELKVLIDALHRRGLKVVEPRLPSSEGDLEHETAEALRAADLVIGVLTRERRSEWILFELGQAWALGKRILLFAPPTSIYLPTTLRRFMTVRTSVSNVEAVNFALDQLLASPEPVKVSEGKTRQKRHLAEGSRNYLRYSLEAVGTADPRELEMLVAETLRQSGVDVLSESRPGDERADLAVWSDELQPFVGNPILVEIKSNLQTREAASRAGKQLASYVAAAGGLWGLLLYTKGPDELKSLPPNVLALPIERLFERLKEETFDDVVRDLRNRRVHGVGL
ncbi:hypothetical protein LX76_03296 [Cereibacter changlensis]|uniref:TIR domain-containing protein n=1 Tax=Cereibacter changlensis TaxID=402884 RepID=A0A2W7R4H6_9RHOB|nr:hypothetical protein LX76_03296 [Cereibacter changlensis]